jgi:hypothetical protein
MQNYFPFPSRLYYLIFYVREGQRAESAAPQYSVEFKAMPNKSPTVKPC